MANGRWRRDYPKPEEEKQALRNIIREANPDILILQEMGQKQYLSELQIDLHTEGLDFPYSYLLEGPDKTRHIALLSKIEPKHIHSHTHLEFTYFGQKQNVKRGLLELNFETGDVDWTIYAVHLKSRRSKNKQDSESKKYRVGEARVIRDFISNHDRTGNTATRYLIAGDFNDKIKSSTIKRFTKIGKRKIGYIAALKDSHYETWTYNYRYQDSYERIDFFILSPDLEPFLKKHSGTIVDTLPDSIIASDHRLIYIDLNF